MSENELVVKLRHQDIDCSNGFTPEIDIFSRADFYGKIIKLIRNSIDDNLVLALDDKWGNGKTTFVKMMQSKINESKEFNVIYFDAFENDYHSDPFISICGKIYEMLSDAPNQGIDLNKIVNTAKKIGKKILINSLKFGVSLATSGLVDMETTGKSLELVKKSKEAAQKIIADPINEAIEEQIKSTKNEEEIVNDFKSALASIYELTNKKTIFIIDELDRARPDFSLDLLERVKHFFSVKGFVFLLVMNRNQLSKSVECRYGNINSDLYLNKFIHYSFSLPKKDEKERNVKLESEYSTIRTFLNHLHNDKKNIEAIQFLALLLDCNGCTLREAERSYSLLMIFLGNTAADSFYQVSCSLLSFLKINNQKLLYKIINDQLTVAEVFMELKINSIDDIRYNYSFSTLITLLVLNVSNEEKRKELKIEYSEIINQYNSNRASNTLKACFDEYNYLIN